MSLSGPRPWEIDLSRLRRARGLHGILLEVTLVLLVLIAGVVAGLATANVAAGDVIAGLADPGLPSGPIRASQYRTLTVLHEYYTAGASTWQAGVLGAMASIFLVLALATRRRLLPDGVSRRRLVLSLAAVGAIYLLMVAVVDLYDEIGWRIAADRRRLLPELKIWNDAVHLTFRIQVPLTAATLALAVAALTPTRLVLPILGVAGGVGLALVLLTKLPFGPLARIDLPPDDFLDLPHRSVRVLVLGDAPRTLKATLPDVGLAFAPPPLGPCAERAASEAAGRHGARDLRGAAARRLYALVPLARFDVREHARRVVGLWHQTKATEMLRWLAGILRSPAPASEPVSIALDPLTRTDELRLGDAAIDVCRALVGRNDLAGAARVKEVALAGGLSSQRLADCVVELPPPPGSLAGSVTVDERPAAAVGVAVLGESLAAELASASTAQPANLTLLAAAVTTRTDSSGQFVVPGLRPGRYRLAILLDDPRYSFDRRQAYPSQWIVVRPGETTTAPPVRLTRRFE